MNNILTLKKNSTPEDLHKLIGKFKQTNQLDTYLFSILINYPKSMLSLEQESELRSYYNVKNIEKIELCLTAEIELTDDNFIIMSGYGLLSTIDNENWSWGVVHTTDFLTLYLLLEKGIN